MEAQETKSNRLSKRMRIALAAAALIAVGGAAGAVAVNATRPSIEMAPLAPTSIRSLAESESVVTLKGQTAEIFGNKFIMTDGSGRALVDTGRAGDDKTLVTVGQTVTVQGRFEHGLVHASFLIGADGKVVSLRPMGPPHGPRGPHDQRGPHGPRADEGPRDAAPPPPLPGAQVPAAPAAAAGPVK